MTYRTNREVAAELKTALAELDEADRVASTMLPLNDRMTIRMRIDNARRYVEQSRIDINTRPG